MQVHFSGVEVIRAPREAVRAFVLDPERVGRCLPDLQELAVRDGQHFVAWVRVGLGPVRGRFRLDVELAPEAGGATAIKLKGSGMGSGLGMSSRLRLEEAGEAATRLHWEADATVSGPLATVGGRLLEGQAIKTIELLFVGIRERLEKVGV